MCQRRDHADAEAQVVQCLLARPVEALGPSLIQKPTEIRPEDFYAGGTLQTFGGHKGYGLAVVVELLGQALTGADLCAEEKLGGAGSYTRAGSLFIAIDPGLFRPAEGFAAAVDATIRRIKQVPPAPGFDEVLLPGEPEQRSKARRSAEGISLPESSWETLLQLAAGYGVDVAVLVG